MLEIQAVRFQNCFSFGNELTEIRFDQTKTTIVMGKNGAGKSSSVLDTLTYALYGKPYRKVKLGQMINSITNRDMVVELDFRARGSSWTVRRGQKPALFEIHRDGKLVDQADKNREMQEWLEKQVLMMDQKTFQQTVVLGSANHVPFMKLPLAQRREVIEDILDIQVFSAMNDVLKERAGGVKDTLAQREKELAVATRELEIEKRHIESLMRNVDEERDRLNERLASMRAEANELNERRERLSKTAQELTLQMGDTSALEAKTREVRFIIDKLNDRKRVLEKEASFYEHTSSCPTCKQDLDESFAREMYTTKRNELNKVSDGLGKASEEEARIRKKVEESAEVQRRVSQADREFVQAKAQLDSVEHRIREAEAALAGLESEAEADEGLIKSLEERVSELGRLRDETFREAKTLGHAAALLKDGGIKARIVSQYVPLMNRLVNKYLASLELFVDFHLDDQFNETIRSRHRDTFSYENFSEGEKLRIDLAILFAWRDIARMRNSSSVDLIIFDEVLDGSLDVEGADYFLKLVRDLTDGCHVFVISHRDGLEDKFERSLVFTKRNNFSKMSENRLTLS